MAEANAMDVDEKPTASQNLKDIGVKFGGLFLSQSPKNETESPRKTDRIDECHIQFSEETSHIQEFQDQFSEFQS